MKMNKFKINIATTLIFSLLLYSDYINTGVVQFNQGALSISGNENIDLSSF